MITDQSIGTAIMALQFTDTHLFGSPEATLLGVDTHRSLSDVIDLALSERGRPDFVLLTGDLSQDDSKDSYRRVRELIEPVGAATYFLPGNHDVPQLMSELLPLPGSNIKGDADFLWDRWQIIMLDSHLDGRVEGQLSVSELERLDSCLSEHGDRYALVCLHHNPVSVHSDWMDRIALENPDELFAVLDRYPQVRGLLWGHVHQEFTDLRRGVMLMATPSTCVQFKPTDAKFGVDEKPPGYRWLELGGDGVIKTAVSRLAALPQGLQVEAKGY